MATMMVMAVVVVTMMTLEGRLLGLELDGPGICPHNCYWLKMKMKMKGTSVTEDGRGYGWSRLVLVVLDCLG